LDIFIYIIGGLLAGLATGLVGLSAATIIAPLFATVLGMDPYIAVGIALASDVFASAGSTFIYIKHKNIHIKAALVMAIIIVIFTFVGSYVSASFKPSVLGGALNFLVVFLGLRFIIYPIKGGNQELHLKPKILIYVSAIIFSIIIGLTSGMVGAGGGLSILALLTMLLRFNLKKAVGTSVFIMTFVALVGAVTHFVIKQPEILPLVIASVSAFIGANFASIYANRIDEKLLNRVIGIFLLSYGIFLLLTYYL
jgi:uncharacterized membrane protein YfcA